MMKDKVLITGADGFIGSHLTETLVRKGYNVKAFTLYNSFNSWGWLDHCSQDVRGNFDVVSGDIRDYEFLKSAISDCNKILHLAALIGIPYSYTSPSSYIDTNIKGTLNVLSISKDLNIEKIIHTSTSEVYGTAKYVPIDENHPLQGQSPYSASKIGADQIALSYYSSFGLPIVTLRPFNTFGPRQSARAVIPTIITQLINGNDEIELGNIHTTRDFSYIDYTVSGFISALEEKNILGETINLGSNFEISISDTVNIICEVMNKEISITQNENRVRPKNSEVERLYACNKKSKNLLNLSNEYEGHLGFKKGIKKTVDWFSNPKNLIGYKHNLYNV